MKELVLIVNPISGKGRGPVLADQLQEYLQAVGLSATRFDWHKLNDLDDFVSGLSTERVERLLLFGGDGTLNRVLNAGLNLQIPIQMIPCGSGDGFMRSLNAGPKGKNNWAEALAKEPERMDLVECNGHRFANVAGLGFDAEVALAFSRAERRGLSGYVRQVLGLWPESLNTRFRIQMDDQEEEEHQAWILALANGQQWGNEVYVAPFARPDDGLLDVLMLRKPKWHQAYGLFRALKKGRAHRLIRRTRCKRIQIERDEAGPIHLDGEPLFTSAMVLTRILPGAFRLIR